MSPSIPDYAAERSRQRLSDVHGVPVKAGLHPNEPERFLREVAKDTIRAIGKQGSAAADIAISEGRLSAKLADGSIALKQLERLGLSYAVSFAENILKRYGPLATPQARARQLVREMRDRLNEIDQYLEHIA
jgi:hypothetical protein